MSGPRRHVGIRHARRDERLRRRDADPYVPRPVNPAPPSREFPCCSHGSRCRALPQDARCPRRHAHFGNGFVQTDYAVEQSEFFATPRVARVLAKPAPTRSSVGSTKEVGRKSITCRVVDEALCSPGSMACANPSKLQAYRIRFTPRAGQISGRGEPRGATELIGGGGRKGA